MRRILAALIGSILLAGSVPSAALAQTFPTVDERGIPTIAPMLATITDAVVNITVELEPPLLMDPLFEDPLLMLYFGFLPGGADMQPLASTGSGVIVDAEEGYILTNYHLVEYALDVTVTLKDQRTFEATVIGADSTTDIALLQIAPEGLSDLPFGDATQLRVGDMVVAVGNPYGFGQTVTSGIISALGRPGIAPLGYEDFILTDASINPGNSGGALVTLDGKLIGINTAVVASKGEDMGIGLAVPINLAQAVMDDLIDSGAVRHGLLGLSIFGGDRENDPISR